MLVDTVRYVCMYVGVCLYIYLFRARHIIAGVCIYVGVYIYTYLEPDTSMQVYVCGYEQAECVGLMEYTDKCVINKR